MRAAAAFALAFVIAAAPCEAAALAGAPAACSAEQSALGAMACEMSRAVGSSAPDAVVVGIAPTSSPTTPLKTSIAVALAVKVALALGPKASAWPIAEDRVKLPHFLSSRPLVVVEPHLKGDGIEGSLELFAPVTLPAATGASTPRMEPSMRLTAARALDAEVRRFLPPVGLAAREFLRLGAADSDVLALACGDLDGTGVPVVASVGRTFVSFGTYVAGKYALTARREQRELAPIAPTPLREPVATAWITPAHSLDFGVTDRAYAVRLPAGGKPEALSARLPWPGGGCVNLAAPLIAPQAVRCSKDEAPRVEPALAEPLDALAGAAVVSRAGDVRLVRAGRRASDGSVVVTDGKHEIRLEHAGAELAVADLDGDGAPELVTSLDTLDPRADAIVVYSWLGSLLTERFRVTVPAGVHALAVCPAPPDRMAPIVLATSAGLWVIR
jgi:hypothetical protein